MKILTTAIVVSALITISAPPILADEEIIPQRLQILLDGYAREKERVLNPVERKLDTALLALRDQYSTSGRLQDALAVSNLITSRKAEPAEKKPTPDTRWRWGSGGELQLKGDGKAKHSSWNEWGSWKKQKDGSILLTSEYGDSTIKFTDENTGVVTSHKGGGSAALTKLEDE